MNSEILDGKTAKEVENRYVHAVYDEIFVHFDETRQKSWPRVNEFLSELKTGDILIDIGCGNGKYFQNRSFKFHVGCDFNENLLQICQKKGMSTFRCDCQMLPLKDAIADACICIAVMHHLANKERRMKVLTEMVRVLRNGGRALIYVWAKRQTNTNYLSKKKPRSVTKEIAITNDLSIAVHENRTEFITNDMLVPWKLKSNNQKEFLRFYHVFEEGELIEMCEQISNIRIIHNYYDQGAIILKGTLRWLGLATLKTTL